jgi:hypothetical protein
MRRVLYEIESLTTEELVLKLNELRYDFHNIQEDEEEEEAVFEELATRTNEDK